VLRGKNESIQYASLMEVGRQLYDAARMAEVLCKIFPGHPARHIVLRDVVSGEKQVSTCRRGARIGDYARHLSRESYEGPAPLGLFPGYRKEGEEGQKSRWFVDWIAMDYDRRTSEELLPLVDLLEEHGIYSYLTHGTTGRGAHLYVFFVDAVPQPDAHRALKTIAEVSRQMGVGLPEIRPSSPYDCGAPILLPYRGAGGDECGHNPLLDPQTFLPVHLSTAQEEILRTEAQDFLALARQIKPGRPANPGPQNKVGEVAKISGGEAWEIELRRLKGEWREGSRQYLTLASVAYGLARGIAPRKIEIDLKALAQSANDPEVSRRMEAVRRTIRKHARGERVAWIRWYERAGLEAPRVKPAPSPEMLSTVEQFAERVLWGKPNWATLWKGKKGLTAWSVYRAVIRLAWLYGRFHPDGVEVSIATRPLADKAAVWKKAALNGLNTLYGANLAKRSESGTGERAGKIVLLTGSLPTLPKRLSAAEELVISEEEEGCSTPLGAVQDAVHEGGAERMVPLGLSAPHLRWGDGRPGKLAEAVLATLLRRGAAFKEEIAQALVLSSARESRDLENTLELLEGRRLLTQEDQLYRPAPDFEDVLQRSCELDGSLDSERRQRANHKEEGERFQRALEARRGSGWSVTESAAASRDP
jgi:hypothetical protein